jgi:hypothetical protein
MVVVSEDPYCDLDSCGTVKSGRWVPEFWTGIL